MAKRLFAAVAAVVILAGGSAQAQEAAIDFGLGYSRVSLKGDRLLDPAHAAGIQIGFSTAPRIDQPEFRLGFHFTTSHYRTDRRRRLPPQPQLFDLTGEFSDLDLYVPELRLSWRQPVAERFFIEPGAGLAVLIGTYTTGETRLGAFGPFIDDRTRRTRAGIGVRPAVRAGYTFDRWELGLDASYLVGRIRFGRDAGPRLGELYIGAFVRVAF